MSRKIAGRIFRRGYRCRDASCKCHGGKAHRLQTYTVEYWRPGDPEKGERKKVMVREATGDTDPEAAMRLLRERQHQLGQCLPVGPRVDRLTFDDMCSLIRADYADRRRRSAGRLEEHLRNLAGDRYVGRLWARGAGYGFRGQPALTITAERVKAYKAARREDGAAEGTLYLELATLKRMFKLACDNRDLLSDHVPAITMSQLDNIREVYIAHFQIAELLELVRTRKREKGGGWHADPQLARLIEFTYITGWRADSDVLTRQWEHVQLDKGLVLVEKEVQKPREGKRHIKRWPLIPRLKEILAEQREWTDAEEARLSTKAGAAITIPWVWHRYGRKIGGYRKSFQWACGEIAKAHPEWGASDWVRHSMRYSAVENLMARGVTQADICKMLGMTAATFERYHRQSEAGVARVGMTLGDFRPAVAGERVSAFRARAQEKA